MQELVERGAGLDIGSKVIVACVLTGAAGTRPSKHSRTFGTMTADLADLHRWLGEHRCTHVAMESTGVRWLGGCAASCFARLARVRYAGTWRRRAGERQDVGLTGGRGRIHQPLEEICTRACPPRITTSAVLHK